MMLKASLRIARASSVLTVPCAVAFRPITRKTIREIPIAGPAVQNMFFTCLFTVRPPPTSFGTRMVVSESGVILSPK